MNDPKLVQAGLTFGTFSPELKTLHTRKTLPVLFWSGAHLRLTYGYSVRNLVCRS